MISVVLETKELVTSKDFHAAFREMHICLYIEILAYAAFLGQVSGVHEKNMQTHIWGYKNISTVLDTGIFWEAA